MDLERADAVVIGGGFFGCLLALELKKKFSKVVILEKEKDLLQKASLNNQARIHGGYHYPRHFLTALRSHRNFSRFSKDFSDAVVSHFDQYYAISRLHSKTNLKQYENFMARVGAPFQEAPSHIQKLFNADLIEGVLQVQEHAFDAVKLKEIISQMLKEVNVQVVFEAEAKKVLKTPEELELNWLHQKMERILFSKNIFNCTYSDINNFLMESNLELIPLRHEVAEMCLIEVPWELKSSGITVMCGPFFSVMPFPSRNLHTLSHVRYTPRISWENNARHFHSPSIALSSSPKKTHFRHMIQDAVRYLPVLNRALYCDSLWEVKTVLPAMEGTDGRPILFKKDHGLKGLTCIMGGKIDNIYDVLHEWKNNDY